MEPNRSAIAWLPLPRRRLSSTSLPRGARRGGTDARIFGRHFAYLPARFRDEEADGDAATYD